MDYDMELQIQQREVRHLRARYPRDLLLRAVFAMDLAIRRAASRVLALGGVGASHLSRSPGKDALPLAFGKVPFAPSRSDREIIGPVSKAIGPQPGSAAIRERP